MNILKTCLPFFTICFFHSSDMHAARIDVGASRMRPILTGTFVEVRIVKGRKLYCVWKNKEELFNSIKEFDNEGLLDLGKSATPIVEEITDSSGDKWFCVPFKDQLTESK
jgi:hypothetical protein